MGVDDLTPSQLQILDLTAREGLTGSETAYRLGISPHTVKAQKTLILIKFGVSMYAVCFLYGRWYRTMEQDPDYPVPR